MIDKPLTREQLNEIYDILVKICGASTSIHARHDFLYHESQIHFTPEYRFCGKLGHGGKFWRNAGRIYVTCYSENETPDILDSIKQANKALEKFYVS